MTVVARIRPRPAYHALAVREIVEVMRARFEALLANGGTSSDWHRLQYDGVTAYVRAQVHFVALHGDILSVLRSDNQLYARLRLASLEMNHAVMQLRELVSTIARRAAEMDSH